MSTSKSSKRPTIERLREVLRYEDGRLFWRVTLSNRAVAGSEALTADDGEGYKGGRVDGARLRRSRVIFAMHHGRWPTPTVDHRNHDREDDKIKNLREASNLEQQRNTRSTKGSSSRFKGVSWSTQYQNWKAQIRIDGKQTYLGRFAYEETAARAYDAAALEAFGEFAHLNFAGGFSNA